MAKEASLSHAPVIVHLARSMAPAYWGGIQSVALSSCRALQKLGYEAKVYSTTTLCTTSREVLRGVEVRRFRYLYPLLGLSATKRRELDRKGGYALSPSLLVALLRERELALLHSHDISGVGNVVRLAARLRRVPYVLSLYSSYYDRHSAERERTRSLQAGTLDWGRGYRALFGTAARVLRDAAAYTTDNALEYEALKRDFPEKPVRLLSTGVYAEDFQGGDGLIFRRRYGLDGKHMLLNLSRVDRQKNQLTIVRALGLVLDRFPDARLAIVGAVSDQRYYDVLLAEISALGLEGRVEMLSGLPPGGQELADAYAACDLLVLADSYGGPNVAVYELWAAGKPVVSARVPGDPGIIRDGIDGLLFDPASPEQLAEKICQVLADEALARRLGEAGRARALSEFSWDRVGEELDRLYHEVACFEPRAGAAQTRARGL